MFGETLFCVGIFFANKKKCDFQGYFKIFQDSSLRITVGVEIIFTHAVDDFSNSKQWE